MVQTTRQESQHQDDSRSAEPPPAEKKKSKNERMQDVRDGIGHLTQPPHSGAEQMLARAVQELISIQLEG